MRSRRTFAIAFIGLLAITRFAHAEPASLSVVAIHYVVDDKSATRVSETITLPVERTLTKLDRVVGLKSSTSNGTVDIEIQFEQAASEQDLASVKNRIEQLELDSKVAVISRLIEIRAPRLNY
jgi:multidrug efflux pump subunit AcrB